VSKQYVSSAATDILHHKPSLSPSVVYLQLLVPLVVVVGWAPTARVMMMGHADDDPVVASWHSDYCCCPWFLSVLSNDFIAISTSDGQMDCVRDRSCSSWPCSLATSVTSKDLHSPVRTGEDYNYSGLPTKVSSRPRLLVS